MKVGLIARADNTGLGNQTWEFYRHMKPHRTMVVDIGHLNGNKQYTERYDPLDSFYVKGMPTSLDIDTFLKGLDCVFVAEAPYNYYLYTRAKELGVKVAVQYNYEFFDWFAYPHYPTPDMLIAPSWWGYEKVDEFAKARGIQHVYLHCPVNRELLPRREITKARTLLHFAGRPAAHDRNGTETVIKAAKYVLSQNIKIVIHFQGEQGLGHQATHTIEHYKQLAAESGARDMLIIQQKEYENYADIYNEGDVMILPRRYGGNCLPLNEALSVGMPVIMPDISPNNQFLPNNWLIPAKKVGEFKPRMIVDIYEADAEELAARIDKFAQMNTGEMLFENITADNLAQKISWKGLAPEYKRVFEELCK